MQAVAIMIRDQIDEFKPFIPLIQALREPGMKDRHFEQLSAQTGILMALKPTITFKSLLILGIKEFEELVKMVADTAAKEYATERTLNKMIEEWEMVVFEILPYKTTGKYTYILLTNEFIQCSHIVLTYNEIYFTYYIFIFLYLTSFKDLN